MNNFMNQNPEAFEDIYAWEAEGFLEDINDVDEIDEFDGLDDFEDDFPISLEYDEGEDDMYPDGDFFTNEIPW